MRWCLRISFAAMCIGLAWRSLGRGDEMFSFLFMALRWSEGSAIVVADIVGYALIAAAVAIQSRRAWPVLLAISAWSAWIAVLAMMDGPPRPELIPGGRAVRILGPLALAIVAARPRTALVLLHLAAAATFACHGIAALCHEPAFLDYIFAAGQVVSLDLSQGFAERALDVIGVVDLVVAVAILLCRGRWRTRILLYMAVWGFATAAMRTVHSGWINVAETLVRVPNGGVPLALWLYWRQSGGSAEER